MTNNTFIASLPVADQPLAERALWAVVASLTVLGGQVLECEKNGEPYSILRCSGEAKVLHSNLRTLGENERADIIFLGGQIISNSPNFLDLRQATVFGVGKAGACARFILFEVLTIVLAACAPKYLKGLPPEVVANELISMWKSEPPTTISLEELLKRAQGEDSSLTSIFLRSALESSIKAASMNILRGCEN